MTSSLQITTLFDSARLGYREIRIPALVRSKRGVLLAFAEGRRRTGDWVEIDILLRRSVDDGQTWSEVHVLIKSDGGPISNPTPIAADDGTIHFLYHRDYARCYYLASGDDGLTWSSPRDITVTFEAFRPQYAWRVIAPGPGHGIQLKTGRLIVPVWLCAPTDPAGRDHRPSCIATIYSDDCGSTWLRGDIVFETNSEFPNPSETVAVELEDGRVMLNSRNESVRRRRIISISVDGASGWTPPAFDESLFDPICMASLVATTDPLTGGRVLVFANPDSSHRPEDKVGGPSFRARENGVVKLSRDNGRTWSVARVLDAGPFSYSDLAADGNGNLFCLYEAGKWGVEPLRQFTHIALARFSLSWVDEVPSFQPPLR